MSGNTAPLQPYLQLLERLPLSSVQSEEFKYPLHLATGAYEHIVLNSRTIKGSRSLDSQNPYRYTEQAIPKKDGSVRIIHVPDAYTANVGTMLSSILQMMTDELTFSDDGFLGTRSYGYTDLPYAMQYMASLFHKHRYVLHLDIHNFFGSIRAEQVYVTVHDFLSALYQKQTYRFDKRVSFESFATECTLNCTFADIGQWAVAVQGSTLTPIISNLVGAVMIDKQYLDFIKEDQVYARYSDDIYIGSNEPWTEDKIQDLYDVLEKGPDAVFSFNREKTEVMDRADKSKFPQILSLHCDDNGNIKIPSSKGKLMKVAAFKSGNLHYSKRTFKDHMRFKGYLAYIRSINNYNKEQNNDPNATGAHPDFKGAVHYMNKLEQDMCKSYMQGLKASIREKVRLSFEVANQNGFD